jgi:hypothetical protein
VPFVDLFVAGACAARSDCAIGDLFRKGEEVKYSDRRWSTP